jgi:hypothetical protein
MRLALKDAPGYHETDRHDDPECKNQLPAWAGNNPQELGKRCDWRFARFH